MILNKELMTQARESLRGKWIVAVSAVCIISLIFISLEYVNSNILQNFGLQLDKWGELDKSGLVVSLEFFITIGAMLIVYSSLYVLFQVGFYFLTLKIARDYDVKITDIFAGFYSAMRYFMASFLMGLFILLWFLLLIIPGIIASLAYSQTFFILLEDKSISIMDAITKSKNMMKGNKAKLFFLSVRFIGWGLLALIPIFIDGFIFVYLVEFHGLDLGEHILFKMLVDLIFYIPLFMVSVYAGVSFAKFYDDIKEIPKQEENTEE